MLYSVIALFLLLFFGEFIALFLLPFFGALLLCFFFPFLASYYSVSFSLFRRGIEESGNMKKMKNLRVMEDKEDGELKGNGFLIMVIYG